MNYNKRLKSAAIKGKGYSNNKYLFFNFYIRLKIKI